MDKPTVASPSPRMAALAQKRELVNDLMGGTFVIREKKKWLPQHPAEGDAVYKTRVEKTFLDNYLSVAIDKTTGKIFSRPIKVTDVPAQLEEVLEDIDMQGSSLDIFAQAVGRRSLQAGVSYVLVDVPPSPGVKSAAEEKAVGIRPYTVHIDPDNLLEALPETVNGKETVKRARILECAMVNDGEWGYTEVKRVRVLEMREVQQPDGEIKSVMCFDVYEEKRDGAKIDWVINPDLSGVTTFPEIMLVPFYSNRTGFMEGETGYQNIAESTLEHLQIKSEYNHALATSCFGMLTATGVEDTDQIQVGPLKVLKSSSPEAKFSYTETTGVGVNLAADALKAIESRIETAGVQLRVENQGKVTATAASLDSEETNAGIVAVANGFADSWGQVLGYMASVMGLGEDGGKVEILTNVGAVKGTPTGLQEINKALWLSDEAKAKEFVRRGELAEDFDFKANAAAVEAQGPELGTITKPVAAQ